MLVVRSFSLFAAAAAADDDAQTSTVTDKTTTMRIIDDELDDDDNGAVIIWDIIFYRAAGWRGFLVPAQTKRSLYQTFIFILFHLEDQL